MMRVLDLFSGIGGFSLGLERTGGFQTVAFCEIEEFPRRVLAKHWPTVPIYNDVRTLTAERLKQDGITADVICGGFPCQDISNAGKGEGLGGKRSGLWSEYARLVGELRPRFVIVENVAALLGRGLGVVLGDLAALGYDAEWHCIPASAVGAPHKRDRIWIVAYPNGLGFLGKCDRSERDIGEAQSRAGLGAAASDAADTAFLHGNLGGFERAAGGARISESGDGDCAPHAANAWGKRIQGIISQTLQGQHAFSWCQDIRRLEELRDRSDLPEPLVCRAIDGISERLYALGNAVVPQIPEAIGRAILTVETDGAPGNVHPRS